jgi:hypothetical protein
MFNLRPGVGGADDANDGDPAVLEVNGGVPEVECAVGLLSM